MNDIAFMKSVDKRFREVLALDDITLHVAEGSTFFLLGPNGSGKTTLIRLLSGTLRPTNGTVRVLGIDPHRHPDRLTSDLGIAYDGHYLPPWASAAEYLRFAAAARGLPDNVVSKAAGTFDLLSYWERAMGTYSAGMRKRVMLAQAWLGDPRLLILDEPFSNLDPEGRHLLADSLGRRAERGLTTLVASHLAEAGTAPTHLAFLLNGRMEADGRIEDLADRFVARSVALIVPDSADAVRLLLARHFTPVTAEEGRVVIRGDANAQAAALSVLQDAGISVSTDSQAYDIWAIYRQVLVAREAAADVPA